MVGIEVVRPLEGMWAPLQARIELRQMFGRWLSQSQHSRPICWQNGIVDELSLLDLCQHYRLEYPGGAEDVVKNWDESEQRIAEGGPTFDELARLGWVFFDGCRWCMQSAPLGSSSHITYPTPSTKTFLTNLGKVRLVAKTDQPSPSAKALAAKILSENWLERHIPTRDPDWLVGRLWERFCTNIQLYSADNIYNVTQAATSAENEVSGYFILPEADADAVDRAFLEWSAWCSVLDGVSRWNIGWGPTEMRYCREAAQRVLERQTLWGTWDNDVSRYIDVLEKTFAIPQDQLRYCRALRGVHLRALVSRADWLKWPDVEYLMMSRLCVSTVSFAFDLLCSELEMTDIGPSIKPVAETVLSFAANHPIALQKLLLRVDAVPALLVDMLMHQSSACLAAKLVIEWQLGLGRNSDRNVSRETQTKAFAVQDSLSLLAYHLREGTLDIEEYASLITWCYTSSTGSGRAVADSRKPSGRQLLGMLAREREELQSAVLQHLVSLMTYENNVPRACFTGVLEGLNCLLKAQIRDTRSIVTLYSKFAQELNLDWTDAPGLSAELAARLVATAFTQAKPDRDALLVPFDSAKLLRETSDGKRLTLTSSIARTMRQHVRLLARAVVGWSDGTVPKELCDALQTLISRSAIEHAEKGRVGALTDRYSPSRFLGREEGSPAQDLAAAWRRLDSRNQEAILQSLAQSDDPVLLAELSQHLPAAAKPCIQSRLRQLKPGEASTPWTWPEIQRRIESLLAAGEYGLAREHLDEIEPHLFGAPQEFRLGFFSLGLQLLLQEKNWIALDGMVVPSTLNEFTKQQAQEQLDFYSATSQLLRPSGNLAGARAVLERLSASPSAAYTYKENFFAVAIQQLLGPNLHPLTGTDKVTGEGLLVEINAMVTMAERQASSSLLTNRALLLLALQRPEDALDSVAARRRETPNPNLELITVLATVEMGRREEAMAILDAAITEFGADDRLIGIKSNLEAGIPAASITSPSIIVDTISSIRSALQQLTELQPSEVGEVLCPSGDGAIGYLTRQVSRAVAALQHMAAILRDRKKPQDKAKYEDDLNTAVREVLGARLAVVKWDVADQSLGGVTSNGNPGERDAVIRVSGQEISIYEALVCTRLDRTNLKTHFDKLLSYGVCGIYFHVTYSYMKKLKPLFDYVRSMLEHEVPPGLTYLDCKSLGPPDYETSGYIATYRADHREIAVVFLIVDLNV
ncbi:hypothetical protein [Aeromonas hydrophila]|uniref:hypothetical protein n=1 Tax=Aeromonas hydrophila TaxID=644 RepID=UPI001F1EBC58|nr:hypothetical protein [Aeromonas hydrophila]BDC83294.1 hypothetical protein NUITMVA1_32370 [Aeromonas hydrophila]